MHQLLTKHTKNRNGKFAHFILISTFLCSMVVQTHAQTSYTISGTVINNIGAPMGGVQVFIKGSTVGDITDLEGNYTITANRKEGDIELQFSFIGYTTIVRSITLGSVTEIPEDVSMDLDVLRLSEVVITGASGLQEKKQLGNTISTISEASISGAGSLDITGSLSGKLAGVQVTQNSGDPAAGISVRLRSASTVNGSSDPLYIIDGVIVNNSSTNVLGVTSVVQNRLSDISPRDIERIEVIKGGAAAAIYGSRASNGVVQIFTKRGRFGKPTVTFSTSVNSNSLRKKIAFNQVGKDWTAGAGDLTDITTTPVTRYDYQDMVFQNSIGTDNYLSVSGGQGNTTYLASLSWLKNNGIMKNTDYDRSGARLRVNQIINDRASFSIGTYVSSSHSNEKPNGGYGYGVLQTILFTDNSINPTPDADGNYPTMTFYPNILEYLDTFDFQQQNKRAISDIQFTLAPIDGMRVNYVFGYDDARSRGTRYAPIGTTTAVTGTARSSIVNRTQMNSDLNVTYETQFLDAISSVTAAGYSYQYDESSVGTISASALALGVKTTAGAGTISTTDFSSERAIWGGYIQQTIGLKDKLFVTGAARIDGSSVFGKDERSQFYPKASLSYIISDEDFWTVSAINNLKIRAAWGQAGNLTAIGPFDRLTNYSAVSIHGKSGLISPSQIGNADLRPERQTETEFGIDLAMFNNRLGLEFTSYIQEIEDLLVERTLAPSTGAGSRIENIANMTNKGIEIQLTGSPVITKDFNWTTTFTFSSNINEVSGIEGEMIGIGNFGFSKAMNGQPLGVFRQSYFARNPDGSLLLDANGIPQRERGSVDANGNNVPERDADGQPTGAILQKVIGDPNADYIASWINELKYGNLTFRAQFDAVQGFDVLSWDSRMFFRFGGGEQTGKELNGEEVKGTGRAKFGIAESYIEDGSFTKLRELSVSYLWANPINGLSGLRFTVAGRNLISFDNYSKWDPEVNMDAQSNGSRGGIMGLIPIPRTLKIGITATF
ncbi:MAG: SusC/RagA family TonB-linked outer membrane protein [Candidatus Marinimicrobia bacterium]|jgi:TonB-linked SusC/RagA family outer membrane protein|nr:SusC/RagA family TonB-linked outer membrane protein [Candidatus Neomarinimicrobiota bacterium]MDP6593229.1 SusC/RagA family TonB-linked outer membrane protein [Candidatus Neomarinimicrobiota bacterium]|tara:strand:- start:6512 stop:9520 length:3009 start_codon:yes stop_codon:yes gene_type:complete